MRVKVRLFASLADAAGWRDREVELPEGATARDVLSWLQDGPLLGRPGPLQALVAINRRHVPREAALADGDEVSVFPPVSGGAGAPEEPKLLLRVTTLPLDPSALAASVRHDSLGAVVTFEGVVRNHSQGARVAAVEYEVFTEMAEAVLRDVHAEVTARWPGVKLAMEHRAGRLVVGETSVVVACAAIHRREAFLACRLAMDRLKESLPAWKHEELDSGTARWL